MTEKKERIFFILIILACVISLMLTFFTFVILPNQNLALGSFF